MHANEENFRTDRLTVSNRSAMGMAAIGVALWKYAMKYSPENSLFFNRDRFVLSNGAQVL